MKNDELLLGVEDGDGGGDAVERAVVGGGLAVELALRLLEGGDVDGGAGGRVLERQHGHVVRLALAADDERQARAIALAARQDARGGACAGAAPAARSGARCTSRALGFDGAHVGGVDPGQPPVLAAQPDGDGQRVEQRAAGAHVAGEALVLGEDAGDLVAVAGDVAEAQHGAAAGGAAVGLDDGRRPIVLHDDVERRGPDVNSASSAGLRLGGRARLEPLAEAQELSGLLGQARDAGQRVGDDAKRLALLPVHQHLRLGADDRARRRRGCA